MGVEWEGSESEWNEPERNERELNEPDDNGDVRKDCNIIRKVQVYEYNRFSKKSEFKARSFLKGVKTLYTEHINSFLNDKDKLQV